MRLPRFDISVAYGLAEAAFSVILSDGGEIYHEDLLEIE